MTPSAPTVDPIRPSPLLSSTFLTLFSNNSGRILVWCQLPNTQSTACSVTAAPASGNSAPVSGNHYASSVTFTGSSNNSDPNPDPGPNPNPGSNSNGGPNPGQSQEPPIQTYAAIDISGSNSHAGVVQGIALDDSNNVAFYSVANSSGSINVHAREVIVEFA